MNRAKEFRLRAGLTQKEVAKRLGVAPATLCIYEQGKHKLPVEIAMKMGPIYGVYWAKLFEGDGDGKTAVC